VKSLARRSPGPVFRTPENLAMPARGDFLGLMLVPRVVIERCGMITVAARRREVRPDASAREDLRDALADLVQRLELCSPSVQAPQTANDSLGCGRRHVVLLDMPERVLPLLRALLEREGEARDRTDRARPGAKPAPRPVAPRPADEGRVLALLGSSHALTPDELRHLAATGEWPAWCDLV
jgi:hypothetical protein